MRKEDIFEERLGKIEEEALAKKYSGEDLYARKPGKDFRRMIDLQADYKLMDFWLLSLENLRTEMADEVKDTGSLLAARRIRNMMQAEENLHKAIRRKMGFCMQEMRMKAESHDVPIMVEVKGEAKPDAKRCGVLLDEAREDTLLLEEIVEDTAYYVEGRQDLRDYVKRHWRFIRDTENTLELIG